MNLFAFGVGYSARFLVHANAAHFPKVCGTVRTREKADRLGRELPGVEILTFDDVGAIEQGLAVAEAILTSVAPDNGDAVLDRFGAAVAASPARCIVYLSTIGVYGGKGGAWVDESTPTARKIGRADARVAAENAWLGLGRRSGKRVFVLRLAGIYGPGRNAIESLRAGNAKRIVKAGQVFNRIHVADIAASISACLSTSAEGGVFNVCDDEPAPPEDVVVYAAKLIGVEPPPEIAFAEASLSPMGRQFWENNQRVSNRRLKEELHVRLLYPSYREGLASLVAGG